MHGLIHISFKFFIVEQFDHAKWEAILSQLGVQEEDLLQMKQYDDETTIAAVHAACAVLGVSVDVALEKFGRGFVSWAIHEGYFNMIRSLGDNLPDVLLNLHRLHQNLERDLRSAVFPIFEVKMVDAHVFHLLHKSARSGFGPVLEGVLKEVARRAFNMELHMVVMQSSIPSESAGKISAGSSEILYRITTNRMLGEVVPPPNSGQGGFCFWDLHAALASMCRCAFGDSAKASLDPLEHEHLIPAKPDGVVEVDPQLLPLAGLSEVPLQMEAVRPQRRVSITASQGCLSSSTSAAAFISESSAASIVRARLTGSTEVGPQSRIQVAAKLFRCVSAGKVAASWKDAARLAELSKVWKLDCTEPPIYFFGRSQPVKQAESSKARFLSHSWDEPEDWSSVIGHSCSYPEVKCAEVCSAAKDLAVLDHGTHESWRSIQFFVDKCCIPQSDPDLLQWCVTFIEEFIQLSHGLVVILSWTYFERLWCVYEWACFLIHHPPRKIVLCLDAFLVPKSLDRYQTSIRDFSLARCKCQKESDRAILLHKVAECYTSNQAFEQFLQFTAIALIAQHLAARRASTGATAILPWAQLAREIGFNDLADCLEELAILLLQWREELARAGTADLQTALAKRVETWFAAKENQRPPSPSASPLQAVPSNKPCAPSPGASQAWVQTSKSLFKERGKV